MKLVVKRSIEEIEDKGFFGRSKEKILQRFSLHVQLMNMDETTLKMLEIYTYLGNDEKRRRYTELPIVSIDDQNLYSGMVTIPKLMKGMSWESDYLSIELVDLPSKIAKKIEDVIVSMQMGKLWSEMDYEEIEINLEGITSSEE